MIYEKHESHMSIENKQGDATPPTMAGSATLDEKGAATIEMKPKAAQGKPGDCGMAFAWIIEQDDHGQTRYFAGHKDSLMRWTKHHDHTDAIRFARKQDAERFAESQGWHGVKVCEHGWDIETAGDATVPPYRSASPAHTDCAEAPGADQAGGTGLENLTAELPDEAVTDCVSMFGKYSVFRPYESHEGSVGWTVHQRDDVRENPDTRGDMIAEFKERFDAEFFAESKADLDATFDAGRANAKNNAAEGGVVSTAKTWPPCPKCGTEMGPSATSDPYLVRLPAESEADFRQWQRYAAYCNSCAKSGETNPDDFETFRAKTKGCTGASEVATYVKSQPKQTPQQMQSLVHVVTGNRGLLKISQRGGRITEVRPTAVKFATNGFALEHPDGNEYVYAYDTIERVEPIGNPPQRWVDGSMRRVSMQQWTPAEHAIFKAAQAVEAAGRHPLLTDAVLLLRDANNKVADFVELPPK